MNSRSTHPSALSLDALDLGVLPAEKAEAARAHVEACARCRADLEVARASRLHFTQSVLPRTIDRVARRPWRHRMRGWLFVGAPAFVAASLILIVSSGMYGRRVAVVQQPGEVRIMGGGIVGLKLAARRGGRVFPVAEGDALAAGDDVRFIVDPAGHRFVLVAAIDGAGEATVYFPFGGPASAAIEQAPRVELPGSVHLDAAPGPERVFVLFSDAPLDAAPVLAELRSLGRGGPGAVRAARTLERARVLGATAQASVFFEKAAP